MSSKKTKQKPKDETPSAIVKEIAKAVADWAASDKELVPQFISSQIVEAHVPFGLARSSEHSEYFRHYAYKGSRADVGTYISKTYDINKDLDEEAEFNRDNPVLPGFEYVQKHYVVRRDGEAIGIPVQQMTDDEIDARVLRLRRNAKTTNAHADELERYKLLRKIPNVA